MTKGNSILIVGVCVLSMGMIITSEMHYFGTLLCGLGGAVIGIGISMVINQK
jgi:hypothetical protein